VGGSERVASSDQPRVDLQADPDVSAIVDEAEAFEESAHASFLQLSSSGHHPDEVHGAVRDSAVADLSEILGLSPEDIDSRISASRGDVAASYLSSYCAAAQAADAQFPSNVMNASLRELSRRRQHRSNSDHSRTAAHLLQEHGPPAAYSSLASRVHLPAQLGYGYRVDTSGIELPPFPDRNVLTQRRRRARDDLDDLVVDDHDSEPEPTPPPSRHPRRRPSSGQRDNDGDDSGDGDSGDDSRRSGSPPPRGQSDLDSGSEPVNSGDSSSSSDDGGDSDSGSSGDSVDNHGRSDNASRASGVVALPAPPAPPQARYGELSPDRLERLLERLLSVKSGGNNGLMAPKPSFWTLGSPPQGGYHLETFTRLYKEFKEFKRIYGKHTGVSFKNLITLDVSPLMREDLKLTRHEWKKLADRDLIRKLKSRLGYSDSDHYIALLESCPKLPDKLKDTTALSNAFKDLSGKMLEVVERAHRHKVTLRKASLKHVFSTAIKSSYRMTNWFHLERFKSIGDSVRFLNTKIKDRLSLELERKHEQEQDARVNGVRGQIGSGHQEGSNAPERRPPKTKGRPLQGISKGAREPARGAKDNSPFAKLSQEEYRKKMDELYKIENQLSRGRHYHEKTIFCDADPCPFRRCQGCGEHAVKGKSAHDRPHCPHRKHKDFVSEGYFHDKFPGRVSIFATGDRAPTPAAPNPHHANRSAHSAKFNAVGHNNANDSA